MSEVQFADGNETQSETPTEETPVTETNETPSTPEVAAKPPKQVRLNPLPESVLHPAPTAVKTIALGSVFSSKVDETNALLDEFASIREAFERSTKALETSDHPLAIEYRKLHTATNETVKALENDSTEAKEIAKLRDIIAAKVKAAREVDKAKRDEAQKEVTGSIVSEFDPETLSQKLTDANTVLLTMKKVLADENPELSKWNVIDPSRAQGKKGGKGSGSRKSGTKRPRLAYAFIDDKPVVATGTYVTSSNIAKELGVNDVGNLNSLMFQAVGDPDSIPATEFHFNVIVNGKEHTIRVAGRTADSSEAEAAA
jgi:hypothetical protein